MVAVAAQTSLYTIRWARKAVKSVTTFLCQWFHLFGGPWTGVAEFSCPQASNDSKPGSV